MVKICAPESITPGLTKFIVDEGVALDLVGGNSDLKIELCGEERLESDLSILYSGGWVSCSTARTLAGKLGTTLPQMGDMLDLLNVKVRQCSLGCF